MPSGRSSSILRTVLTFGSLPALLAASYFYFPASLDGPPFCLFKLILGLPCMGCGLTRAFGSLTHLDFAEAMRFHFLAPVVFLYLVVWYVFASIRLFRSLESPRWWRAAGNALVVALVVLYSGRMVAFFSCSEGLLSPVKQNMTARLIRWDWSNTYEPWATRRSFSP